MSQRLQKEQRDDRKGAVAGPQALRVVAECEYYGIEAITQGLSFRTSARLFSRNRYYREEGETERGEGQSLTRAARRASRPPRLFSRARACAQMRDG